MPIVGDIKKQRIFDYLNNYRFHVIDISFQIPVVLNLSYGFARVSMPEVQVDTKDFKEGNYPYKRSVTVGATVSDIVLEQGVRIFNSDFYDWISDSIQGVPNRRRNLLLVQFSEQSLVPETARRFSSVIPREIPLLPGLSDLLARAPGRAWILKDCLPVAYKGGSDLDALGNEISIASLTVRPNSFHEINLGLS